MRKRHLAAGLERHTAQAARQAGFVFGDHHTESVPGQMELALDELAECLPDAHNTEAEAEAAELERLVNDFLQRLPERECNIFLRRYWYVEEYSDIARRYDMKLNTVKTSLFRTRGKLREYLEREGVII